MKTLTTFLLAALLSFAVLALPGCSLLGDPVAEKVADAIDKYCEEPQGARQLYRETINAELAGEGHSIAVTCQGDTQTPETQTLNADPTATNDLLLYVSYAGPPS